MTRKVLIVDDSKLARMSVAKVLKALHPDWAMMEAGDSVQALASIDRESPDFVLLDYNMPGKDGLALAAQLRESNADIRVAVISANHQLEVIERARASGATFIRKPLTEAALAEFLNGAAASQSKSAQ
ncbi:MAG: response regulator [Pseudomonadota bacterium]|nr:response regulator [Pseudomonadota bacterium]